MAPYSWFPILDNKMYHTSLEENPTLQNRPTYFITSFSFVIKTFLDDFSESREVFIVCPFVGL